MTMEVSRMFGHRRALTTTVASLEFLVGLIAMERDGEDDDAPRWCPSVFNDGVRSNAGFLHADVVALDVDGGCTLDEAKALFGGHRHIIATTRNHQKPKTMKTTGRVIPACDRFRVVLFPAKRIRSVEEHRALTDVLRKRFPFVDEASLDPAHLFFRSHSVESFRDDGELLEVPRLPQAAEPESLRRAAAYVSTLDPRNGERGLYRCAIILVEGFALELEEALPIAMANYARRCDPPWPDWMVRSKLEYAVQQRDPDQMGRLLQENPAPYVPRKPSPVNHPRRAMAQADYARRVGAQWKGKAVPPEVWGAVEPKCRHLVVKAGALPPKAA